MILMDLNEQADRDFGRARRRSWLRRLVSRLRGEPASRRTPPSFDEARRSLRAFNRVRRGVRVVDLAFHQGKDLPPVSLYRLDDAYFVEDGNHRVSVARYHGADWIEAYVTEFRPARAKGRLAEPAPGPASRAA